MTKYDASEFMEALDDYITSRLALANNNKQGQTFEERLDIEIHHSKQLGLLTGRIRTLLED